MEDREAKLLSNEVHSFIEMLAEKYGVEGCVMVGFKWSGPECSIFEVCVGSLPASIRDTYTLLASRPEESYPEGVKHSTH